MKKLIGTVLLGIVVFILYFVVIITADNVGEARAQINDLENAVHTVSSELANLKSSRASAMSELSFLKEENKKLAPADKHNLRIPTFNAVKDFLATDPTNTRQYIRGKYDYNHFARDVTNAAKEKGLRCAVAAVVFPAGTNTFVVAFQTTDSGVVFVDPMTDRVINVNKGGRFCSDNNLSGCNSNDIIVDVLIYW